ncbi:MAG TPA: hypothetical protein PLP29_00525 [Candidatus Ozemobacteraceae bacterium]|nr:hypothetical protein [Candidatus Ozemobacteraceae bacterium]
MRFDEGREEAVAGGIREALDRAVALAFLVTAGLVGAGHLGLVGSGLSWSLAVREPVLVERLAAIAAWDLGSAFLVLRAWRRPCWRSRAGEALLALIASLILWRVLLGVAVNLAAGIIPGLVPAWAAAFAPPLNADLVGSGVGLAGLWMFALALGIAKETIARGLFRTDERLDSPLCNLFAWHHRKDAVFTLLGTLAATVTAWGGASAGGMGIVVAIVKLALLGTACTALVSRCLSPLLSTTDVATGERRRDKMGPAGEDGKDG